MTPVDPLHWSNGRWTLFIVMALLGALCIGLSFEFPGNDERIVRRIADHGGAK